MQCSAVQCAGTAAMAIEPAATPSLCPRGLAGWPLAAVAATRSRQSVHSNATMEHCSDTRVCDGMQRH